MPRHSQCSYSPVIRVLFDGVASPKVYKEEEKKNENTGNKNVTCGLTFLVWGFISTSVPYRASQVLRQAFTQPTLVSHISVVLCYSCLTVRALLACTFHTCHVFANSRATLVVSEEHVTSAVCEEHDVS